ncbi:peptidase inhibitor family I36 protein [Amycolatopsis sp. FBCC-B4732]|uniref:peptidase inhibitor family I36 protein n=1 Tax=Amycolatopsis sp. FBCC-B4732 TaxID=3079339 RepID=UPI001FF6CF6A|nr:peptidase inhibitor family I36 protein [Amycolatopsis sp. FBCC-B4732]UOX89542.1 peptidase inhibitor family I36 protein [Amycolatopsis sp. FBCC-B4732]
MSSSRLRSRLPQLLVLAVLGLLTSTGVAQAASPPPDPACQKGEFCLWSADAYGGESQRFDLRTANPGECIPLPEGFAGSSFANLMSRDVTVYQDEECSTEGDFITYPGGGTFVPNAPFLVRAVQIWE